jgi:hypothetical protein
MTADYQRAEKTSSGRQGRSGYLGQRGLVSSIRQIGPVV